VVDFPGVYNALLGQPCFTKFMVVPNYTYLKLKMLGPMGVSMSSAASSKPTTVSKTTSPKQPH